MGPEADVFVVGGEVKAASRRAMQREKKRGNCLQQLLSRFYAIEKKLDFLIKQKSEVGNKENIEMALQDASVQTEMNQLAEEDESKPTDNEKQKIRNVRGDDGEALANISSSVRGKNHGPDLRHEFNLLLTTSSG